MRVTSGAQETTECDGRLGVRERVELRTFALGKRHVVVMHWVEVSSSQSVAKNHLGVPAKWG